MAVYVDDMRADYGRMQMCHMMADTTRELMAMVDRIGVRRKWIQKAGTRFEHFDVCLSKRKLAVQFGAIEVTSKEMVLRFRERGTPVTSRCAVWPGADLEIFSL